MAYNLRIASSHTQTLAHTRKMFYNSACHSDRTQEYDKYILLKQKHSRVTHGEKLATFAESFCGTKFMIPIK